MNLGRTTYLIYLSLVVALGAAAVAFSAYKVVVDGLSYQWLILAYLTILTGAFTIRIPGVNSKISVADTFIFINTILFGVAAGVLTAALDGCLASIRFETPSRRRRATPFNTAVMGLSVFAAGEVFFKLLGRGPLSIQSATGLPDLVLPAAMYALVYYLGNSMIVAFMVSLDDGDNAFRIWGENFLRTAVLYLASAAAGALIAFCIRTITPLALITLVPILVAIYFVEKIYLGPDTDSPIAADNDPVAKRPAYRRFHYFMVALGLGLIFLLTLDVLRDKVSYQWMIVAVLAACAGFITVKIPGIKIKITIADTFVFANTILFGPVVGGITAALDGLAGSLRCKSKARRWEFTFFNMGVMAVSAFSAGAIFFRLLGSGPLYQARVLELGDTFLPALVLAISYYLLNALGVAIIVALQAEQKVFRVWRENLLWGVTTYVACAFGAVLFSAGILAVTPGVAIGIVLLLATVYATCRAFAERLPQGIQPST
jgi:uncharacterized membrane protein